MTSKMMMIKWSKKRRGRRKRRRRTRSCPPTRKRLAIQRYHGQAEKLPKPRRRTYLSR